MPTASNSGELVAAVDEFGEPLENPVTRKDAHREGTWHRTVAIFAINRYGEILMEKRSESKDLFPGYFDIIGGHLHPGETPVELAVNEIREELTLTVAPSRLDLLAREDSVIERVVLPEKSIINRELKSVYLLRLDPSEETEVLRLGGRVRRASPAELEAKGILGEVSDIQFWSWEELLTAARLGSSRQIASGTLSALADDIVRENVAVSCKALRNARRSEFAKRYPFVGDAQPTSAAFDKLLFAKVLPELHNPARAHQVSAIIDGGLDRVAGAYRMGSFRQLAAGDEKWEPKLNDTAFRYVRNLLSAIQSSQEMRLQSILAQKRLISEVQEFVDNVLNFPLVSGSRFRDGLGNLADIAAGREAVLLWLRHNVSGLDSQALAYPTKGVTQACLNASHALVKRLLASRIISDRERLHELVLLGLCASSTDFNNPDFQLHLKAASPAGWEIGRFLESNLIPSLSDRLGGSRFLEEFIEMHVESHRPATLAYLSGNSAQGLIGLAIAQEILKLNPFIRIKFIPKSGSPSNDLTFEDVSNLRVGEGRTTFAELARFEVEGRFTVERDGPNCHGIDPARISEHFAGVLSEVDCIVAEGQAYAEICGWRRPAYVAFRANGRVAQTIHGVPRGSAGFVKLTPSVDHFLKFTEIIRKEHMEYSDVTTFRNTAQTTADYVEAILSETFSLVRDRLFERDHLETCLKICTEAGRLGKTFAQVVLGAASRSPRTNNGEDIKKRFDVFACGGGGGFNAVTLKALQSLGMPTVAGVPSTDDGGSTGDLQRWLRDKCGFVFGVGDMAAVLQEAVPHPGKQALLAFRFDVEPDSLPQAVIERVLSETRTPTYPGRQLGAAPDFLSFVCDQLNFARIIQEKFRGSHQERLPVFGASIRNLNVIAAYELCNMLGEGAVSSNASRALPCTVLKEALGIEIPLLVMPVTYAEGTLYVDYQDAIPNELADRFHVPTDALSEDKRRLYGQQYIDKLPHAGARLSVGVVRSRRDSRKPTVNPDYLARLKEAKLFVMGAGSLIGSQLAQLTIQGVVDELVERKHLRRILVLNHVNMDETLGMSVKDQIVLIEKIAAENLTRGPRERASSLRISDVFTDIVVPRTVAQELRKEMLKVEDKLADLSERSSKPESVDSESSPARAIQGNRYVRFLLDHPEIRRQYAVTAREVEVLSYLEQPIPTEPDKSRKEKGRYRGAVFATEDDIAYLVAQGIQRRSIHEVDSIGRNLKFVKSSGTLCFEDFPGLVPEALGGIFRIALERGSEVEEH